MLGLQSIFERKVDLRLDYATPSILVSKIWTKNTMVERRLSNTKEMNNVTQSIKRIHEAKESRLYSNFQEANLTVCERFNSSNYNNYNYKSIAFIIGTSEQNIWTNNLDIIYGGQCITCNSKLFATGNRNVNFPKESDADLCVCPSSERAHLNAPNLSVHKSRNSLNYGGEEDVLHGALNNSASKFA